MIGSNHDTGSWLLGYMWIDRIQHCFYQPKTCIYALEYTNHDTFVKSNSFFSSELQTPNAKWWICNVAHFQMTYSPEMKVEWFHSGLQPEGHRLPGKKPVCSSSVSPSQSDLYTLCWYCLSRQHFSCKRRTKTFSVERWLSVFVQVPDYRLLDGCSTCHDVI